MGSLPESKLKSRKLLYKLGIRASIYCKLRSELRQARGSYKLVTSDTGAV